MTVEKTIRLMMVDDHPLFRQGVRLYLQGAPGIQLVGEASDGNEALEFLETETADVILMDLQMPGPDGIEVTTRIKERWPQINVLLLTSFGSWEKIMAALKAGASGYILKDADPDELLAAINAVSAGGSYLGNRVTAQLLNHMDQPAPSPQQQATGEPLTEREREVLALVARGQNNREIAEALFVSEKTVKTHVANILQKLQVKSRTQAALYAMKNGLVQDGETGE